MCDLTVPSFMPVMSAMSLMLLPSISCIVMQVRCTSESRARALYKSICSAVSLAPSAGMVPAASMSPVVCRPRVQS